VAYDEELATRIRALVADEPQLTEKKMFGGLAFLIGGNMAIAASGQGGILVRVDPDAEDDHPAAADGRPAEIRGRAMHGWLRVDAADIEEAGRLRYWAGRGVAYARSLPSK
jgi:hypothetical protein